MIVTCFRSLSLSLSARSSKLYVCIFQGQSGRLLGMLEIIIPRREIPKWFNHECTGHELNIQVPSCGCDDLIRIALCVVFEPNGCYQHPKEYRFSCSFNEIEEYDLYNSIVSTNCGIIVSHHLWLLYLSNNYVSRYMNSSWGRIFSQIDANGFRQLKIKVESWSLKVEMQARHGRSQSKFGRVQQQQQEAL